MQEVDSDLADLLFNLLDGNCAIQWLIDEIRESWAGYVGQIVQNFSTAARRDLIERNV